MSIYMVDGIDKGDFASFSYDSSSQKLSIITASVASYKIVGRVQTVGVGLQGVTISCPGLPNVSTGVNGYFTLSPCKSGMSYTMTPSKGGYKFVPEFITRVMGNSDIKDCIFEAIEVNEGKWADEVDGATWVDKYDPNKMSYISSNGVKPNTTKYFLVDPKAFGIPWPFQPGYCANMRFSLIVSNQTGSGIDAPKIYLLDLNDNELGAYTMAGSGDYSLELTFKSSDYVAGKHYLIEVIQGEGSGGYDVVWKWMAVRER